MPYLKIEAKIIPARHLVTIGKAFSGITVKQAFAKVPDNASVFEIDRNDDGTYTVKFEEAIVR